MKNLIETALTNTDNPSDNIYSLLIINYQCILSLFNFI